MLIDCYLEKDKIVLWIRYENRNLRFEDSFTPKIYVRKDDLKKLRSNLFRNKIKSNYVKKKNFFGKEEYVLEIPIYDISKYNSLTRYIEKLENLDVDIYNAGLQIEEYYMYEKDIFPLCKVEFEAKDEKIILIKTNDDSDDTEYKLPEFKICRLGVKTKDNLFKGYNTKIERILFGKEVLDGTEKEILEKLKEFYEKEDPDVLWTENGNLFLPFLKEKFREHGIGFKFNRFDDDEIKYEQGEFYDTYSRVVYRTHSIFLKGRLHFDTHTFFADDIQYYGILDVARGCRIRIQRAEMRSAGACVTNLLLYVANKLNFLLPYKTGIIERFKTLEQLYEADRGSMIFEPETGLHTDVIELDFVSLYPNIMNKFNLSPETLFCKCCKNNKVPGLHYNYCTRKRGIVPIVAKKLIERRVEFKRKGDSISKQKVDYLKWCLVTLFGYQAFKNRKIGTIESHESIQAYAREIMLKVVDIAETNGWGVIHGIIDSVYLKKKGFTDADVQRLGREIYEATRIELSYEGSYRWIVFLPSILDKKIPVPSHYYGVFSDGDIKYRGIEARRKDTCRFIEAMQIKMLETLAPATDEKEFRGLFPKVFGILCNHAKMLPNATADDLMITKTIAKTEYKNEIAQKAILKQMDKEGFKVQPGMTIQYVIRDIKSKDASKRYRSIDSFDGKLDLEKYKEMLVRAAYSLLEPFGVEVEELFAETINQENLIKYVKSEKIAHEVGKTLNSAQCLYNKK